MQIPDYILGTSTLLILLAVFRIIWVTRGWTSDVERLKDYSHKPPCNNLEEHKEESRIRWEKNVEHLNTLVSKLDVVATDVKWLVEERKNGKK